MKNIKHSTLVAIYLMIYDLLVSNLSYLFALWIRFDCAASKIPTDYFDSWVKFIPIYCMIVLIVFVRFKLYRSIWQFASFDELSKIIIASLITGSLHIISITILFGRMPVSYYIVGFGCQFVFTLAIRFSYRYIILLRSKYEDHEEFFHRVMIIGAGAAGRMVIRDINIASKITEKVVCIIDDNPNKWGRYIEGVEVVGGRDDILSNVKKYHVDKIYLAIPSATPIQRRDILNICKETSCELKNLPGVYQFLLGEAKVSNMKKVEIEDLLGRESIKVDMEEIYDFIKDKVILVTGGGGSIGSELSRQIAAHHPKQLIIFDIYENNAHAIQLELRDNYPDLNLEVIIGSVRDTKRLEYIFSKYHPDVVYHAAAHKHVPLMEDSPCESIKNNAIGTYKTAYAAMKYGCKRFVLISTDKAVNPTNIMGASKRLCEMVIQAFDYKIKQGRYNELPQLHVHNWDELGSMNKGNDICIAPTCEFVAVRFGNVLGSNGSVIPRFKEQIAKGGPVTVTHPDIIRYFMTIPEATSLVLQAGTYAKGGEIFVLDMGSPVKIDSLARNLIKLSGLVPDVDIKVMYTGLRPGEKLYEEKLMSEEGLTNTPNNLIHIGKPIPFDVDTFLVQLQSLMEAAYDDREEDIRKLVQEVVTTFQPAGRHGSEVKTSTYKEQIKMINE